ncbi:MAG: hypothetical protein HY557_01795 [Euryarchaeota archaeon]|nr:hypothetical protein [Euryarchaeota archaeon]
MSAGGQALSKINPLDLLDAAMTVVGFIPGLDIISDVYFLGHRIIDANPGKGLNEWPDLATNAAGPANRCAYVTHSPSIGSPS